MRVNLWELLHLMTGSSFKSINLRKVVPQYLYEIDSQAEAAVLHSDYGQILQGRT